MMELEICKRLADHVLLLIFVGLSVAPTTGELSKTFMYLMEKNFQLKWIIYNIHIILHDLILKMTHMLSCHPNLTGHKISLIFFNL